MLINLFGLLVGTLNLLSPNLVFIPFGPNGQSAEGLDGIGVVLASTAVLGAVFGGVALVIMLVFDWGTAFLIKAMKNNETQR